MFAGVGERTREGNDLYREMIESGVIKLGDKQVTLATSQFLCELRVRYGEFLLAPVNRLLCRLFYR